LLSGRFRHIGAEVEYFEHDRICSPVIAAVRAAEPRKASTHRHYAAMEHALDRVEAVGSQRPRIWKRCGQDGIEERVAEFVEEALALAKPGGGSDRSIEHCRRRRMEQFVLRTLHVAIFRSDLENVSSLAAGLWLRAPLGSYLTHQGCAVGGLCRKQGNGGTARAAGHAQAAELYLPVRMKDFPDGAGPGDPASMRRSGARNLPFCSGACWIMWGTRPGECPAGDR